MYRTITMIGLVLAGLGLLSAQNRAVFGPLIAAPPCPSAPQGPERNFRFVCFDLESGGYLVRYPRSLETGVASDTDPVEFRIELRDLSDPKIEVHVNKLAATGDYGYVYEIENGSAGRRPIESWAIVTASEDDSVVLDHPRWRKGASARPFVIPQVALAGGPELRRNATMGRFARWSTSLDEYPIAVGERAAGFVVKSSFRPGWTTAYVGAGEGIRLPTATPGPVREEISVLARPEIKNSLVLTIGPKFSPDATPQWVASDWNLGVQKLVNRGRLSDSAYVQGLLFALVAVAASDPAIPFQVKSQPGTPEEREINRIVHLAFGIEDSQ